MSVEDLRSFDFASVALLNRPDVQVLGPDKERALLLELDECKKLLLKSCQTEVPEPSSQSPVDREIQDVVRDLLDPTRSRTEEARRLVPVATRYNELRTQVAMANLRLVAHVAKKYRDRGLGLSDLLQEGFCGLLKAIDRFDPAKETRLASYAVWWIRQALQRAVAAGAYPVRLNPRHLQQLAQSNPELNQSRKSGKKPRPNGAATTIKQIHSATRPTISLDANRSMDEGCSLLNALSYPAPEEDPTTDLDDYVIAMMQQLKPREQVVLKLRFGLSGAECHSLSQVSEVLDVSKERIRQIQECALQKLRILAKERVCLEVTG